jgi:integrase/recombinase XerD
MMLAQIVGCAACPRGLRHSFGVGTLQARVPPNVTQKWMGHTSLRTTMIYNAVCGPEEVAYAEQFWNCSAPAVAPFSQPPPKDTNAAFT